MKPDASFALTPHGSPAAWFARPWIHGSLIAALLYVVILSLGAFSYTSFLIVLTLVYAIAVMGLNIPAGMLGQLSMGQGAAFALGAYVTGILVQTYEWPLVTAVPVAFCCGLSLGALLGIPAARLNTLGLGMVSLGVALIATDIANVLEITGGPNGIIVAPPRLMADAAPLSPTGVPLLVLIVALLCYLLHWWIRASNVGRVLLAMKSQEIGALALGVNPFLYKILAVSIGTGIGALAGSLFPFVTGVVSPDSFGINLSFLFLLMVILGGGGTRSGPVMGTAVLGVVPLLLSRYPGLNVYVYGVLLVALMRILPRGIISRSSVPVSLLAVTRPGFATAPAVKDAGTPIVTLQDVSRSFSGINALSQVRLSFRRGEITAIVGPNGSGKTTLLNVVCGYFPATSGRVLLGSTDITRRSPYVIAQMGVGRTFQVPKVFPDLSIAEHLRLAQSYRHHDGDGARIAGQFLAEVGLGPDSYEREVRTLGHGHLRFLEIGMVAMRSPDLVLLDEPAAGLSAVEIDRLISLMKRLADVGMSVVVVEHHLDLVKRAATEVAVMHLGRLLWSGPPSGLHENSEVREAYLGAGVRE